jgi:hypothetical protein
MTQTHEWGYRYIPTARLSVRKDSPTTLEVFHKVQHEDLDGWTGDIGVAIQEVLRIRQQKDTR